MSLRVLTLIKDRWKGLDPKLAISTNVCRENADTPSSRVIPYTKIGGLLTVHSPFAGHCSGERFTTMQMEFPGAMK